MANKKSFTGWCFQCNGKVLIEKVYRTRHELIEDWITADYNWKALRKLGHRAVKVEVKIIEK